jgi:hypothetical protein
MGAEWEEQQAIKVKRVEYKDGKRLSEIEEVVTVPVARRDPPDSTACIFWLKNRKPKSWLEKVALTGPDGGAIKSEITVNFVKPDGSADRIS